jgi:periplasmic divalent cation tolerance protein
MKEPVRIVLCTCPDETTAGKLANVLVEAGLAACVTKVKHAESIFRWEGRIETAEEVLLLIKSTPLAYEALERVILEAHPYEVPEIIAVDTAAGLPAYMNWIEKCVSP